MRTAGSSKLPAPGAWLIADQTVHLSSWLIANHHITIPTKSCFSPDVGGGCLIEHALLLEAEAIEQSGPHCELRGLTECEVLGDAVLHVVRPVLFTWGRIKLVNFNPGEG